VQKDNYEKYPNSRTLFQFCKQALQQKFSDRIKVIDQDVGAILGYDPADCSHWKRGKKNIKSFKSLNTLAKSLDIDPDLIISVIRGKISLEEALFEIKGYDNLKSNNTDLDSIKKKFFQNNNWNNEHNKLNFHEDFLTKNILIHKLARNIGQISQTLPVDVKIIINNYSKHLYLQHTPFLEKEYQVIENIGTNGICPIFRYKNKELLPFVKYNLLKLFYKTLLKSEHPLTQGLKSSTEETDEIYSSLFAGIVLIPQQELENIDFKLDPSSDLIKMLADKLEVSKTLVNEMIRYYYSQFGGGGENRTRVQV
jgi:hypothetical protein